jgi:uncharacterized repeat protein (TIGR03803 family)
VFKLDPSNNETVLHSFTGGTDGSYLESGLIVAPSGYLYGTSANGGPANGGAIFEIQP